MRKTPTQQFLAAATLVIGASLVLGACGSASSTAADTTKAASPVTDAPVEAATTEAAPTPSTAAPETTAPAAESESKGFSDKDREEMRAAMKAGGTDDATADCALAALEKEFSPEELQIIVKADGQATAPSAELEERAKNAVLGCAFGAPTSAAADPAASDPVAADPAVAVPTEDPVVSDSTETTIAAAAVSVGAVTPAAGSPVTQTGSKSVPIPVGTTVAMVSKFDLTINKYTGNATGEMLEANSFNDKPPAGQRYAMVNVTVTNRDTKTDKRIPGYNLTLNAISKSGKTYESTDCVATPPKLLDAYTDLFTGSSLSGNICFLIADADADGLVLYTDQLDEQYNASTYYFELS
jgi:hypothetical protein